MTEISERTVIWGSDTIAALLRERYPAPEWVLAFEVANGTGSNARRYADAVAMNCYPSKGCELVGFEIKISRGDWLRELKRPDKTVPVASFCDRWYVVAPDAVVKKEELPRGWGLIVAKAGGLRVVVQPPANEDPKAVNRSFMASMLRRAGGPAEAAIKAAERQAADRAVAQDRLRQRGDNTESTWERKFKELQSHVHEFEKASGVHIEHGWDLAYYGEAVRDLCDVNKTPARLKSWSEQLTALQQKIAGILETIKVPA